jgi:hypothetical protein
MYNTKTYFLLLLSRHRPVCACNYIIYIICNLQFSVATMLPSNTPTLQGSQMLNLTVYENSLMTSPSLSIDSTAFVL